MNLLNLCNHVAEDERCVIRAIVNIIPSLHDYQPTEVSEAHFGASYVHPFLQGLFGSESLGLVAHCAENIPDKQYTNRLDYTVDGYESYSFSYTNVFGDIKPSDTISPTLLVKDFYRIAIFCKNAVDNYNLQNSLGVQVTGQTVTCFAMTLGHDELYTFTEVARFSIPKKKSDLKNIVGYLDELARLSVFQKHHCRVLNRAKQNEM